MGEKDQASTRTVEVKQLSELLEYQDGSIVSRMASSNDLELRPVSYIAAKMSAPFKHCRLSASV